jgi:hypothetical protein
VLILPRRGVPVAFEVAKPLRAQLNRFLVRKVGLPDHEAMAIGAVASGGITVINHGSLDGLPIPEQEVKRRSGEGWHAAKPAAIPGSKRCLSSVCFGSLQSSSPRWSLPHSEVLGGFWFLCGFDRNTPRSSKLNQIETANLDRQRRRKAIPSAPSTNSTPAAGSGTTEMP